MTANAERRVVVATESIRQPLGYVRGGGQRDLAGTTEIAQCWLTRSAGYSVGL